MVYVFYISRLASLRRLIIELAFGLAANHQVHCLERLPRSRLISYARSLISSQLGVWFPEVSPE
jgi:hypothetical protein